MPAQGNALLHELDRVEGTKSSKKLKVDECHHLPSKAQVKRTPQTPVIPKLLLTKVLDGIPNGRKHVGKRKKTAGSLVMGKLKVSKLNKEMLPAQKHDESDETHDDNWYFHNGNWHEWTPQEWNQATVPADKKTKSARANVRLKNCVSCMRRNMRPATKAAALQPLTITRKRIREVPLFHKTTLNRYDKITD